MACIQGVPFNELEDIQTPALLSPKFRQFTFQTPLGETHEQMSLYVTSQHEIFLLHLEVPYVIRDYR